jgi:hypothetical protein
LQPCQQSSWEHGLLLLCLHVLLQCLHPQQSLLCTTLQLLLSPRRCKQPAVSSSYQLTKQRPSLLLLLPAWRSACCSSSSSSSG